MTKKGIEQKDKYLIVITSDKYPLGDAGAIRTQAFSKIFQALGYKVFVLGMGKSTDFKKEVFDGTEYCSFRYPKSTIFFRILGRLKFFNRVKKFLRQTDADLIAGILYVSGGLRLVKYIKKYSAKKEIPLYYDCVEWYSPSEFKCGNKSYVYRANNRLNSIYVDEQFKVFSISRYLQEYYEGKRIKTLRVPVVMAVDKISVAGKEPESKLTIVYAGSMGNKDRINMFIDALSMLSDVERSKIEMVIIGCTQDEYEEKFGKIGGELINRQVFFKGRIERGEVLRYLEKTDFTMLMRPPEERYAKAGFPTKVVESLAAGIPIICNYSSDLSLYLSDCQNAVIVEDYSVLSCSKALKKAIELSPEKRAQMRLAARETAEKYFHYENYIPEVKKFIDLR